MPGYRLISYLDSSGSLLAGVVVGDDVYRAQTVLADLPDSSSVIGILKSWDKAHSKLEAFAGQPAGKGVPLRDVKLQAPVLYPGSLFCAGANYWDHLEEMADIAKRTTGVTPSMTKGAEPWFFMKTTAGSIIGDGAPVKFPNFSKKLDWEAELGVVIARPTRNISEAQALDAVAGYLIVNDLSARDLMKREGTPFIYDWIGQKCFEDGAPMGPWLTPAAYVRNPANLGIKLWVNGVLKQDSNTSRMIHNAAEQIAYLSRHVTLQPGDIIATGTPAGVGLPRGEFLKIGDEVKIEIEQLGTLTNRLIEGNA